MICILSSFLQKYYITEECNKRRKESICNTWNFLSDTGAKDGMSAHITGSSKKVTAKEIWREEKGFKEPSYFPQNAGKRWKRNSGFNPIIRTAVEEGFYSLAGIGMQFAR